ncbi:MAG: hypothetical protein Fur0037_18730 [Planctomycetota bacterium]
MRIAAFSVTALLSLLAGCTTGSPKKAESPFVKPNSLMAEEIENRISNIPYQHREELLMNLQWLAQQGETAIPALLRGLKNDDAKTRSSCAWTLGRIADRRVIPELQKCIYDESETVRLEVARQLLLLGDYSTAPTLIEGLDSERKEVRYLCHEALKSATGRDFGFDHLSEDETARTTAILGWRQWWSDYSGDALFAQNYAREHGLQALAAPMAEPAVPGDSGPGEGKREVLLVPDQKPSNENAAPAPKAQNNEQGAAGNGTAGPESGANPVAEPESAEGNRSEPLPGETKTVEPRGEEHQEVSFPAQGGAKPKVSPGGSGETVVTPVPVGVIPPPSETAPAGGRR